MKDKSGLSRNVKESEERIKEKKKERLAKAQAYIELCKKRLDGERRQLEEDIRRLEFSQENDSAKIDDFRRRARVAKKEFERLDKNLKSFYSELAAEFDELVKLTDVSRVDIGSDFVEIFTEKLSATKGKKKITIGEFSFKIFLNGKIQVEKLDEGGFSHPCVINGMPVLGEETLKVVELLANYRITEVVKILLKFVEDA